MEFYYLIGNERKGPFSISELKYVGLKDETLVWAEGLEDWKPASEVEELQILIKTPPIPNSSMPKQKQVEEQYEKAIEVYLNNGYDIISQSTDTTILLSPKFRRKAGLFSFVNSVSNGASSAMAANMNVQNQQSKYQATIRITKTGKLQITGCTLPSYKMESVFSSINDK